eukprot:TRINITY_DN9518_c0_g1_i1.p1 TRINITY_DN9518_c0_g1~~TRINITY_DN9518_c0_g1_i1.p1  ORF type:complete len:443 (+),score=61.16 TRINITY_DN9518_c0_g1_i1:45-1331(+)
MFCARMRPVGIGSRVLATFLRSNAPTRGAIQQPQAARAVSRRLSGTKESGPYDTFEMTTSTARAILKALASKNKTRHVFLALEHLSRAGTLTSRDHVLALAAVTETTNQKRLLEREGFSWTQTACSAVLRACRKAGEMHLAMQLIDQMRLRGISPHASEYLKLIEHAASGSDRSVQALRTLLLSLCDIGSVPRGAMELMRGIDGVWTHDAYRAALQACAQAGRWGDALRLLNIRMRQRSIGSSVGERVGPFNFEQQTQTDKGIQTLPRSWTTALNALGTEGRVDEMLALYKNMRASGHEPDVIAINDMLAHAGSAGNRDVAEALWRELRDLQLQPTRSSYNALVRCYAVAKDPEKEEAVLKEMSESACHKPDASAFTSLMKAYMAEGCPQEALNVFARMRAARVWPDFDAYKTWTRAVDAIHRAKKED